MEQRKVKLKKATEIDFNKKSGAYHHRYEQIKSIIGTRSHYYIDKHLKSKLVTLTDLKGVKVRQGDGKELKCNDSVKFKI